MSFRRMGRNRMHFRKEVALSRGLGYELMTAMMSAWFSDGQKPAGARLQDNRVGVSGAR